MALELQISTQQAQANIEAANAAIRDFITVTQQLSRGVDNIERFTGALNSIRPVSAEVAASINALGQSTNALAAGAANIERFAAAMGRVNGGAAAGAAASIENVGRAAASLNGSAIDAVAAGMSRAGAAAEGAVSPMARAMAASNGFRSSLDNVAAGMAAAGQASATTGAHLDVVARGMTSAGQAAAAGVGNFNNLGNAARGAGDGAGHAGRQFSVFRGIVEAMVFSAAISGLASLVERASDATQAVQSLKIQIDNITGVSGAGAQAFEHLTQTATQLGAPIETLTKSFGRFVVAFTAGGHNLAQAERVYDNFAVTFRAMGLSADSTQRAFIAVDQVFQKGKVQMEELVRQLGQSIPAMELLAKSMGLVDDAGKPMVSQLQKMMKAGEVTSDVFIKFSEDLRTQFMPAIAEALKTPTAALASLSTGLFQFANVMGASMWGPLIGQVNAFGRALGELGGPLQGFGSVLGAIIGGVGAAFLYVVRSWGEVLGTFAQALQIGGQALSTLGGALNQIVPEGSALRSVLDGIGSVIATTVQAFGPLAAVVGSGALAVGAFTYALGLMRSALLPLGAAIINALTNPFVQYTLIAGAVVVALGAVAVAIKSVYDTVMHGGSFADNFRANLEAVGQAASFMTEKIAKATGNAGLGAEALAKLGFNADGTTPSLVGMGNSADDAGGAVENLGKKSKTASDHITDAAHSADGVGKATRDATGGANGLASGFGNSASAANGASIAYGRAAAAARDYAAAAAAAARASGGFSSSDFGPGNRLTGGSFGGDEANFEDQGGNYRLGNTDMGRPQPVDAHDFNAVYPTANGLINTKTGELANGTFHLYYGGTAEKGGVGARTSAGKNMSFVGAPHFAGGGVTPDTTGGIPSILHSNEAVVPLRAGGTIPVSLVGTSAPNGDDANPLVTLLQQIAQDDVTRDALLGQHNDKLDLILGQLTTAFPKATEFYQNALAVLNSLLASYNSLVSKIGSGGGSGSFGGGGGGSGSYSGSLGTSSLGDGTDPQAAFREAQGQIAQINSQLNTKFLDAMQNMVKGISNSVFSPHLFNPSYLYQQYYQSDTFKQNEALGVQAQQVAAQFDAQFGAGAYEKMQAKGKPLFLGGDGFATGSPNASRDASGGFTATLHPDEAVIPLPDGRSVPVQLPSNFQDNMDRTLAQIKAMLGSAGRVITRGAPVGGGSQATTHNNKITFIVNTPDANSFRKSQPQIVADLRGQLQRAQQTSGAVKRLTEDPTKRIVMRK